MIENNEKYMHKCLLLAEIALKSGNPPVGAILIHNDIIIGEGIESGKSTGDITNHAEILVVRDVIAKGHSTLLNQATLYTTHEPCIMCAYVLRHHKIPNIVFGVTVDFIGGFTSQFNVLSSENIPKWGEKPKVIGGVCEEACIALNKAFQQYLIKK